MANSSDVVSIAVRVAGVILAFTTMAAAWVFLTLAYIKVDSLRLELATARQAVESLNACSERNTKKATGGVPALN